MEGLEGEIPREEFQIENGHFDEMIERDKADSIMRATIALHGKRQTALITDLGALVLHFCQCFLWNEFNFAAFESAEETLRKYPFVPKESFGDRARQGILNLMANSFYAARLLIEAPLGPFLIDELPKEMRAFPEIADLKGKLNFDFALLVMNNIEYVFRSSEQLIPFEHRDRIIDGYTEQSWAERQCGRLSKISELIKKDPRERIEPASDADDSLQHEYMITDFGAWMIQIGRVFPLPLYVRLVVPSHKDRVWRYNFKSDPKFCMGYELFPNSYLPEGRPDEKLVAEE